MPTEFSDPNFKRLVPNLEVLSFFSQRKVDFRPLLTLTHLKALKTSNKIDDAVRKELLARSVKLEPS